MILARIFVLKKLACASCFAAFQGRGDPEFSKASDIYIRMYLNLWPSFILIILALFRDDSFLTPIVLILEEPIEDRCPRVCTFSSLLRFLFASLRRSLLRRSSP